MDCCTVIRWTLGLGAAAAFAALLFGVVIPLVRIAIYCDGGCDFTGMFGG